MKRGTRIARQITPTIASLRGGQHQAEEIERRVHPGASVRQVGSRSGARMRRPTEVSAKLESVTGRHNG